MILNESYDVAIGVDGTEDEYKELLQSVIDTDKSQLLRDDLTPFLRKFFEDRIADYEQRISEYEKETQSVGEALSDRQIAKAQETLEKNSDCFCVLYGYEFMNKLAVELPPEVFYSSDEYRARIEKIVHSYDKHPYNKTFKARESDFVFYTLYNRKRKNEEIETQETQESSSEKRIEYKGFYIVQFDMKWSYNDEEWLNNGVVICLKDASDKNGFDIVVYAEDENEEVINFKSIQEAKDWIDKYSNRIKFKVKHGNELHACIVED